MPLAMCNKCVSKLVEFDLLYSQTHDSQSELILMFGDPNCGGIDVEPGVDVILEEAPLEKVAVKTEASAIFGDEAPQYVQEQEELVEDEEVYEYPDADFDYAGDEEELELDAEFKVEAIEKRTKSSPKKVTKESNKPKKKRIRWPAGLGTMAKGNEDELIRSVVSLQCNDCSHSASTFDELMAHYKQDHDKDGVLYCCERKFTRRFKLLDHVRLHVNPNEFACEICKKQFNSRYYLADHMASHIPENEREFQCTLCQKRYSTKSRLANHMKSHNQELNFKCHHCDKA